LKPLVIAGVNHGGQLMLTSDVENFPGYEEPIPGPELMHDLRSQAESQGAEVLERDVSSLDFSKWPFTVTVKNLGGASREVFAKAVIVCTGAQALWLGADGENALKGRGVSTCATCDGAFYKNQEVVVVGGGDAAMEEAVFLTRFASKVTLVHRKDTFEKASKTMEERARAHPKIEFKTNRRVKRWVAEDKDAAPSAGGNGDDDFFGAAAASPSLTGVILEDTRDGVSEERVNCTGAFIAIGHRPMTDLFRHSDGSSSSSSSNLALDSEGYIVHSQHTMTSVPGVFAAGDVVDKRYRQAITAAGMGCQAAMDAERWVAERES